MTDQPSPIIVLVMRFAAIDAFDLYTPVVIPGVVRVHLCERRPVPDAAHGLAGPFPLPEKTRATGQLPLQDDVLIVVVVALALTGGIGCFDQSMASVIAVENQGLLGAPGILQRGGGLVALVLDGGEVAPLIAQTQRPTGTVVEAHDPVGSVALYRQTIAIGIADGGQVSCPEVVEAGGLAHQGNDQLFWLVPQINRCPRQAVVNGGSCSGGEWKRRAAVFVINPADGVTIDFQPMRQGMTPAESQAAIHFDGTGAINADELERQQPIQRTIAQGQQFFTGDHRHRAAVGRGLVRRVDNVAIGVFRRGRGVVAMFLAAQPGAGV
ncbi:hypothetical protein D3C73_708680 [compost metagenome]